MPFYLFELSYTQDAVKAMIANPSDREAAARKLADATGGKLHHMFFAFGTSDVVCLIEAPDDSTMAAVGMLIGASGTASRTMTTKLLTMAEGLQAMKIAGKAAGAYIAPMN